MKTLAPILISLIMLMAFISALSAQSRIVNPELPNGLVFQWRIQTPFVPSSWKNDDFTVMRQSDDLIVFYGTYTSLEDALAGIPELPAEIPASHIQLIPFFQQTSIRATDALILLSNRNTVAPGVVDGEQAATEVVSFSVYFGTYEQPMPSSAFPDMGDDLSFEVMPNRTFAYAAGRFETLQEAEAFQAELVARGYEFAEVNKFLCGQRIAMVEMEELYAYVNYTMGL